MNRTTWTAAAGFLILALTAGSRSAAAQCHGSAGHSGHAPDHATAAQRDRAGAGQPVHRQAPVAVRPQHGGQVAAIEPHVFEVVYLPLEVRVYLFDMYRRPLSVAGVEGEVVFTVAADRRQFRYPLAPAAPPALPRTQDYLRLPLDLSGVAPGQVEARFHFTRLPHGIVSPPEFVQQVVLATPGPAAEQSAQQTLAAQTCPVTGAALGSMGKPVKVVYDGKELQLCCAACIDRVKTDPARYFGTARSGN